MVSLPGVTVVKAASPLLAEPLAEPETEPAAELEAAELLPPQADRPSAMTTAMAIARIFFIVMGSSFLISPGRTPGR